MKAMILAAGLGKRMRPLTDRVPKPLLKAGNKALIEYHLENLAKAGIRQIVINHGLYGELIENALGDGSRYEVAIAYSPEGESPLETGGGIYQALALLQDPVFVAVNADVWTDYRFSTLPSAPNDLAHLVLVRNPDHHPDGDFNLVGDRIALETRFHGKLTFSGIGVYRRELFDECTAGRFCLAPVLRHAIARGMVSGERYDGAWFDVGTPERLADLDRYLRQNG